MLTLLFGGVAWWRIRVAIKTKSEYATSEGMLCCFIGAACLLALVMPAFYELTKCLPSGVVR